MKLVNGTYMIWHLVNRETNEVVESFSQEPTVRPDKNHRIMCFSRFDRDEYLFNEGPRKRIIMSCEQGTKYTAGRFDTLAGLNSIDGKGWALPYLRDLVERGLLVRRGKGYYRLPDLIIVNDDMI